MHTESTVENFEDYLSAVTQKDSPGEAEINTASRRIWETISSQPHSRKYRWGLWLPSMAFSLSFVAVIAITQILPITRTPSSPSDNGQQNLDVPQAVTADISALDTALAAMDRILLDLELDLQTADTMSGETGELVNL